MFLPQYSLALLWKRCPPRRSYSQHRLPPGRLRLLPNPPQPPPRAPLPATPALSSDKFLAELKAQAIAAGVSQHALAEAAPYLVYDQGIVNRDRGQRVFGQIFTEFAGRMAADSRMQQGRAHIQPYAAAFARAEKEYGVPPAVIAAFWGLESDFGANMGNCRRCARWCRWPMTAGAADVPRRNHRRAEDHRPRRPDAVEMVGSWAGELGQTQFLPTHYFTYAVDYDGDGRRDLLRSARRRDRLDRELHRQRAEVAARRTLAAGSARLTILGFPWDQADLTIKLPRAKWAQLGVTYPDGKPLPNDELPASLLLPMGRMGPAFLAYANFAAYTEWNNSLIYSTTAGYLATRIAGAAPMRRPATPVAQLPFNELRELQQLLGAPGFNVGKIDGVMGQQSRTAVKAMQIKYGLPADSWPTAELLARMRGAPRAQSAAPETAAAR